MKNLILVTTLFLATATSVFANECESVDMMLAKFKVGLVDQLSLSEAIECNVGLATTSRELCNTKKGLKQDQLNIKTKMFDVGLITEDELEEAKKDLSEFSKRCNL